MPFVGYAISLPEEMLCAHDGSTSATAEGATLNTQRRTQPERGP